jgi:hypothetical protein
MNAPLFQPFEGANYSSPAPFPGRLLVLGESHYLAEGDASPNFTQRLLQRLVEEGRTKGFKTPYFRNVFYILTGKRSRDVSDDCWANVWNSVAFYNYIQSLRISGPRIRPTSDEWLDAKEAFRNVLSQLNPQLVLITGIQLLGHAGKIDDAKQSAERPGILLPTRDGEFAYARATYHPSSARFLARRQNCLEVVQELLSRND